MGFTATKRTTQADPGASPAQVEQSSMLASLLVNYSEPECVKAIDFLREAGFRVFAAPVSGIVEPELLLGSETYLGLEAIHELVEALKKRQAHS